MPSFDIREAAATAASWQEPLYEHLHAHPELSMQESATAATISEHLTADGYQVQQIGGGVVGVLRNGSGPAVAFRADIDGLPVRETTGLPYASSATMTNRSGEAMPVMHACGHDMHITAGLGVARVLAENQDAWSGTYIALFQPGEETGEGAQAMVDDDLVGKVPAPDVVLGQHVLTSPEAGKVMIAPGPVLSTAMNLTATVYGEGTHGSMPHLGIDPVVLAAAIVTRIQAVVAREIAPGDFGVITVGSLVAGSQANIIADRATLQINFRAYSAQIREQLTRAVERIITAECQASGSPQKPDLRYSAEFPLTDNDAEAVSVVRGALVDALGEENVTEMPPQTGSEDFPILPGAWGVPYVYWGFGGFTATQEVFSNHNPKFAPAMQPTLTTGTAAALAAILAYLGSAAR